MYINGIDRAVTIFTRPEIKGKIFLQ